MDANQKSDSSGGRVSGREMADALADVLQDQKARAQIRREPSSPKKPGNSPLSWAAFVVFSAISGYLWIGSPAWLQPAPPDPIPPLLEDAGLRMEVFDQALLIEDYRERVGRLPNSLSEAGDPFSEVEYHQLDEERYRLVLVGESARVEFASEDSLELFLGDAIRVIKEGG